MSSRTQNHGILRTEAPLSASYVPETPIDREAERQRIREVLEPLGQRRLPDHLLVHGPPGVGKTVCVKQVVNEVAQEHRLKPVYLNCWQYNTRPSILTELLLQLDYPVPRKGKPVDELLAKLQEWLTKNRSVIIVFDEFDQLKHKTEVVYDLQMLSTDTKNSFGLIMISNHPPPLTLDARSRSRLNYQTLQFKPYTAEQLIKVLEDRVEQAFKLGTVPEKVLTAIAEKTAQETGDCRQALKTLLTAGRKANRGNDRRITMAHLE